MEKQYRLVNLAELDALQIQQYRDMVEQAWPKVILSSETAINAYPKIEEFFPHYQLFLIDLRNDLIAAMSTTPFYWDGPFSDLPNEGWDWLIQKGIDDFNEGIMPNYFGGLHIIVRQKDQGKGLSKIMIDAAKNLVKELGFTDLLIPIRPTLKHLHPEMEMKDYLNLKKDGDIYDPWIRRHLKSGAEVVKICYNSMNVSGTIQFWEEILNQKIERSGIYTVDGGLNMVAIDVNRNFGEYQEANIWINHTL